MQLDRGMHVAAQNSDIKWPFSPSKEISSNETSEVNPIDWTLFGDSLRCKG